MSKLNGLFFTILQNNESFFYLPKTINEYYLEEMREIIEQFEYNNKGLIQYPKSHSYYATYHKINENDEKEEQCSLFLMISAESLYHENYLRELSDKLGSSFKESEWFESSNILHKKIMQFIQKEYCNYESSEYLVKQLEYQSKTNINFHEDLDVSLSYKLRRTSVRRASVYYPNESLSNEMKIDANATLTALALHQNSMNNISTFPIKENESDEIAYWGQAKWIMAIVNIVLLIILIIAFIIIMIYIL